ncbi:hypothetical protein BCR43DRAFT_493707 [Syncephalastrum racemosum]|uniref:Uncharacterized protein n=1 Tax=Syncephalastrum racemosum TaxID=13706 RepID=A0A1X2HB09_SYNRA|nr:hypothetical protein BCR43DRAFT_493707 [Syncephalastrum racemosum]
MTQMSTIASLKPDQYGIELTFQVAHKLMTLEADDNPNDQLHTYLVADTSASIIFHTRQNLKPGERVHITRAYTQVTDRTSRGGGGPMSLVALEPHQCQRLDTNGHSSDPIPLPDHLPNMSNMQYERRLS